MELNAVQSTNRTNLELKRWGDQVRNIEADYQSYQSGIETSSHHYLLVVGESTNRTNLELKLD